MDSLVAVRPVQALGGVGARKGVASAAARRAKGAEEWRPRDEDYCVPIRHGLDGVEDGVGAHDDPKGNRGDH